MHANSCAEAFAVLRNTLWACCLPKLRRFYGGTLAEVDFFSYLCSRFSKIMVLEIFLIVAGIALVLWGADRFTDGATGLARMLKVSELVIGLTVVALGTSLPEFMVSFLSVLRGSSDMSVGNIIGSNVFNILVILGASAIMRTMKVEKSLLRRDIPICLAASVLLCIFSITPIVSEGAEASSSSILPSIGGVGGGYITRWEGLLLVAFFCAYLYMAYRIAMKDRKDPPQPSLKGREDDSGSENKSSLPLREGWGGSLLLILVGMAALVVGGHILVDNAAAVAREWGVSESVIGATILAAGTSLPELATSVIAAHKGSLGLAFGNVIGSNVFNIAFVIGTCSSIVPMEVTEITQVDWLMLVGSCILVWIVAFTRRELRRWEGILLVLCYLSYLVSLLLK